MFRKAASVPFLIAFGALARADVLDVPGDFPDIQSALDAAQPGDTILVHGGQYGPIVIDKPVAILGDPAPLIVPSSSASGEHPPLILLQGPGSGRVVLDQVQTGGVVNGFLYFRTGAAIAGGGFSELAVYDSSIQAPSWAFLTGLGYGGSGIETSVPHVLLADTLVVGGRDLDDICTSRGFPGHAGVSAPLSTVVVLDSTILGGSGDEICVDSAFCDPAGGSGGVGGAGLIADRLFRAQSTIQGGEGGDILCFLFDIGDQPDGPDLQVNTLVELPGNMRGSVRARLGSPFDLEYVVTGDPSLLAVGFQPVQPFRLARFGWVFLDPRSTFLRRLVPGRGYNLLTFNIPSNPALLGLEFVAQIYDPFFRLVTRPVQRMIVF